MATLQKIRNRGPLLVAVIGIALFAFVAGDAWKAIQPHQGRQDIGEIYGETISAQDYQTLVDEYTEVIKMTQGASALNDDQMTQVKDQVWQSYINNKLIEAEAEKLGLTVSDAEMQDVIEQGVHPLLMQTPFRNPQTGAFDKDMLKKFLVDYSNLNSVSAQMPAQYVEYYQQMGAFWNFVEKTLKQSLLAEKYQSLIVKSLISNPVAAEDAFNGRTSQTDVLLAAIPYSSVNDSTVAVSNEEIKALYKERKEEFKQLIETRNIKYIDVLVTPSEADRAMKESFYMSNMCPQDHNLNTKDWNDLETKCRQWARRYGKVYIVCGPIYNGKRTEYIGEHRVKVPDAFYKAVLINTKKNPIDLGFYFENEAGERPLEEYLVPVDKIEAMSGIDFFPALNDEVEERLESKKHQELP